jgi:arylsulfatase
MLRLSLFRVLYVQVLVAILLGAGVGYWYPQFGVELKPLGDAFINVRNASFTITADVDVPANGSGVILCQGGAFSGWTLYLKNGRPTFTYNWVGLKKYDVVASQALKPGKNTIVFDFKYDGGKPGAGGVGTMSVNGARAGEARIDKTNPYSFGVDETADVGTDDATWVTNYGATAHFNGHIGKVTIEVHPAALSAEDQSKGAEVKDTEAASGE